MISSPDRTLSSAQKKLIQTLLTPWKMRIFYFRRLPSLFFWGVKVRELDTSHCRISLPFSWYTKNPFRSTYFSAQAGAAELSTGLLVLLATHGGPSFSMLVINMEMQFHKKVRETLHWQCDQGDRVWEAVEEARRTGEGVTFRLHTKGRLADGTVASEATITWSVKVRNG